MEGHLLFPPLKYLRPSKCLSSSLSSFISGSDGKESACNVGDGFNPWVRKISCRREWLPTPVFLPGESHGQKSLVNYSPWGHKESDMTEQLTLSLHFHFQGSVLRAHQFYLLIQCYLLEVSSPFSILV